MGQPLFDLISNIIKRRSYPSISDGMHLEIRIKKYGISFNEYSICISI